MRTGILDEARPRRARLSQRSKITKVTKAQGVASADHRRDPLDRWARASGKARKLNLKIETRQGDAAVMQDLSKSAPRLIFLLSHICVSNWSRLRIRHVTLSNIPRLCMQYVTFVSQICRVCVSNMSRLRIKSVTVAYQIIKPCVSVLFFFFSSYNFYASLYCLCFLFYFYSRVGTSLQQNRRTRGETVRFQVGFAD